MFGVLVATLLLFLTFADWNALRGPISRFASAATGREISIQGDLDVDPWRLNPRIRVEGLHIGNPAQFRDRGEFAVVNNAEATVRWLPLLVGHLDFVRLDLNGADISLYRGANGVSNWSTNAGRGRPLNLPAIRYFSLNEGQLRFEDDKRNLNLEATFTTSESRDTRNPGQFSLAGEGQINNRPFNVALTGAPLLNVRRDRPYAFQADVTAGGTHIIADGAISRPFNFSNWYANVRGTGEDLADLYTLIGLALPNTPPYNLTGRVARRGQTYAMSGITGRVGDSDLSGAFTATRQRMIASSSMAISAPTHSTSTMPWPCSAARPRPMKRRRPNSARLRRASTRKIASCQTPASTSAASATWMRASRIALHTCAANACPCVAYRSKSVSITAC
ncbi:MAG: AsmA family protein [Caulobacteraceae bacterium]|nr:AsmA family protein [Caulobacteraceae bacterium]